MLVKDFIEFLNTLPQNYKINVTGVSDWECYECGGMEWYVGLTKKHEINNENKSITISTE